MSLATDVHLTYQSLCDAAQHAAPGQEVLFALPPGYRVVLFDHQPLATEHWLEVGLINDIESSVVYYWKAAVSKLAQIDRWVAAQKVAWCFPGAQHAAVLHGLPLQIFLKLIAPRYDLVVSDDHQQGLTTDRWLKQLSTAIGLGLHVYVYESDVGRFQLLPTQRALEDFTDQVWSASREPIHQKALISLSPFSSDSLLPDQARP